MTDLKSSFKIRDPIHGFIYFDQFEKQIIDCPYFQRLRRIHQLSINELIFPGGNHTRFSHCLGVMYLSSKYAQHLFPENSHLIKVVRLAGLLHDIGHGPFSHTWDDTIYKKIYNGSKGHDQHRIRIIKETCLQSLIRQCGVDPQEIIDVWQGTNQILHAIIQGSIGADRIDYLLRDSYYIGTRQFGTIEYDRIINESLIYEGTLHYNKKIQNDIFHALNGRTYMYENIYHHKTNMAGNIIIKEIIKHFEKSLVEQTTDLNQFVNLDETFIYQIPNTDPCFHLVQRFKNRQLPKLVKEMIIKNDHISNNDEYVDNDIYVEIVQPIISIDKDQFIKDNIKFWSSDNQQSLSIDQLPNYQCIENTNIIKRYYKFMDK